MFSMSLSFLNQIHHKCYFTKTQFYAYIYTRILNTWLQTFIRWLLSSWRIISECCCVSGFILSIRIHTHTHTYEWECDNSKCTSGNTIWFPYDVWCWSAMLYVWFQKTVQRWKTCSVRFHPEENVIKLFYTAWWQKSN